MTKEVLTLRKQLLTDCALYCIFTYQNDVENFMGIIQFANSETGHNLHLEFVDWAFDQNMFLGQGSLDLWLETAQSTFDDYLLLNNCKAWIVLDDVSLFYLIATVRMAKQTLGKYE